MALHKFANNAASTLAGDINATVTTFNVANTTDGNKFPAITGTTDYFYVTLIDSSNNREIVKVTNRVGAEFTVVRGQDGTTAQAFSTSDRVELRITTANLSNFLQAGENTTDIKTSGAAASNRYFTVMTDEEARWSMGADDTSEAGSDAGSDFEIVRYDDDGAALGSPIVINRATGKVVFANDVEFTEVPTDGTNTYDAFPSGTNMVFGQATVPTGWTKVVDATHSNSALRLNTGTLGTGGTRAFTTTFTARTIAITNLPAHSHASGTLGGSTSNDTHNHDVSRSSSAGNQNRVVRGSTDAVTDQSTDSYTHSHTLTITGSTASVGGDTPMDFDVTYVDVYMATKD